MKNTQLIRIACLVIAALTVSCALGGCSFGKKKKDANTDPISSDNIVTTPTVTTDSPVTTVPTETTAKSAVTTKNSAITTSPTVTTKSDITTNNGASQQGDKEANIGATKSGSFNVQASGTDGRKVEIYLTVDWKADYIGNGKYNITTDMYLRSFRIFVGARTGCKIALGDAAQTVVLFDTPAISVENDETSTLTKLATKTMTLDGTSGSNIGISVEWVFNGVYSNTEIGNITATGAITLP